jgi:class 3 adenylate cyclase
VPSAYILPDQRLVECSPRDTVLSAALRAGVPFAHACGGHSSCSTCRVIVVEGRSSCAERTVKETGIAERLGFPPEFRLACQTRLTGNVTIRRLVLDDLDTELADIRPGFRRRARGPVRWAFGGGRRARPRPIGDVVHAAVLFADIRGFTSFSAALLPYDVIHVLQRHLRQVTRAVEHHGGVVTSYMGDGVMALFAPGRRREPVGLRAVKAGLDMLSATAAQRQPLEELYGRSFELNVGVHVGDVIAGTLFGTHGAPTAIGDIVNVASRVEQANKEFGTRVLMSDAVLAEVGDAVTTGRTFRCRLPGTADDITLLEVTGAR